MDKTPVLMVWLAWEPNTPNSRFSTLPVDGVGACIVKDLARKSVAPRDQDPRLALRNS